MFESARLKLTAWYVLIILLISGLFSLAFYQSATKEIQRIIDRVELTQRLEATNSPLKLFAPRPRNFPSVEELKELKERAFFTLLMINGLILVSAGGASYFLAGRTLKPIKTMIEEQQNFISNASHELRTPIATLRAEMEASLLEKRISDKKARSLITSNLEEVSRLQQLSNYLLRLTQLHNRHKQPDFETVTLKNIIMAAHKRIAALAKQKNITIKTEIESVTLKAQVQNLTELFVILLDNAIKYSHHKSNVSITAKKTDDYIVCSISDTGIGISEKDLPHIFKRFYRADKSRSGTDGYGLGLSIAQNIAQAHHGSIMVTSKIGQGSTVVVKLPHIHT